MESGVRARAYQGGGRSNGMATLGCGGRGEEDRVEPLLADDDTTAQRPGTFSLALCCQPCTALACTDAPACACLK